ncbi:hypothetical protein QAD02_015560 [Eretmocerus hayati]|uniref:Uncharacterized protein n=1 Tax=Eretmocerus hayati TaxID=131215 RepID=A0ACC2P9K6_9HYME|nr:hypothetical protein QAD02_015560 [Eretmocerus hayati]
MDKEKISAARKRLKEFQRHKKGHVDKNKTLENSDTSQEPNASQVTSLDSSSSTTADVNEYFQKNELKELFPDDTIKSRNESPDVSDDLGHNNISNISPMPSDVISELQLSNGHPQDSSSMDQSFTNHQLNESDIDILSKMHHDINQTDAGNQDFPSIQFDQSNFNLSTSNSLQKEHLLQMANAIEDAVVEKHNWDEAKLSTYDLEQRNQFLTSCLEEQKKLVHQLHIQVSQYTNKISELEAVIATKDAEFQSKFLREVSPLKEQIQLDAQTIGILVGEKAELIATNTQSQAIIKQKIEEINDLSGNFKISQQRELELEREVASLKKLIEESSLSHENLQQSYNVLHKECAELKKQKDDFELEISELKQKLSYKNTECLNLQQELQEKMSLLSLNELRLQQLTNSPQDLNTFETQHQTTKVLEQQLSQMKEALQNLGIEKEEASKKYQSYAQQLEERQVKLLSELETAKKVIVDSEIREQSYIQRLSELEQHLQKNQKDVVEKPQEDHLERIEMLTKSMDNLVLEQENLQSLLNEKDNEIEILKKELKELEEMRDQNVDASKLAVALQSEQIGASRAVSQNQQLKVDLDEMHEAYIQLSNTKLDLTEQLLAERAIGKKLNTQLNEFEQKITELTNQLAEKDAALLELEKEKLRMAQIEDQIQHYRAQSFSATTATQKELNEAVASMEELRKEHLLVCKELDRMKKLLNNRKSLENSIESQIKSNVSLDISRTDGVCTTNDDVANAPAQIENSETDSNDEPSIIPTIPEPIKKLEERFKETMERVAELTDEKQRLEHLVLQLQGETETIEEYVTLYQKQRAILQEKAREKENTFKVLLEQRNQQQEQLHKLKILVAELLKIKSDDTSIATATVAEENMQLTNNADGTEPHSIEVIDGQVNKVDDTAHRIEETKSRILDLLTNIKDCNSSCLLEPNFHPCPWCSGKLITV